MDKNKRILVVDDNVSLHRDFTSILCACGESSNDELSDLEQRLFGHELKSERVSKIRADYQVDSAYQGEEALAMVRRAHEEGSPYTVVFMDVRMPPGWDGIETVERIWSEFPETETVICSAYTDYSWEKIIEKLGETDRLLFLAKPFDPIEVKQMALTLTKKSELGDQARNYIADLEGQVAQRTEQIQEVLGELERKNTELQSSNNELRHIALHDDLTGLPNRSLFRDRLQRSVTSAQRNGSTFAVLLLDANNFKQINDTFGHHAGDIVLSTISRRLSGRLRESDTVARLGGDEFAIILNGVSTEKALSVSQQVAESIEPPIVIEANRDPLVVQVSVGVALYPEHGDDHDSLLRNADTAMYVAKGHGASCELYDNKLRSRPASRTKLVGDLRLAIAGIDPGFSVHYQPIVDIKTNQPCGVEALARWSHPQRGNIGPDEFVPLAENSGLIQQLTLKVLDTVIRRLSRWHADGIDICASVNLSTRNFVDPVIAENLRGLLRKYCVSADKLKLEITESMTISNPERALEIISDLKNIGIQISIDDFGTGFSSLAYLQDLPVDELKIDRMFIRDLNGDSSTKAGAIVKSTIDLASNLHLSVVAEGVETERDVRVLKEMGCDKVQGYFISKPMPEGAATLWLKQQFEADSTSMGKVVSLPGKPASFAH